MKSQRFKIMSLNLKVYSNIGWIKLVIQMFAQVFNRTTHLLYRLANPPFPDDVGRDADIVYKSQSSGNLTSISYAK